ncbi:hypothetical protein T484DRAFT_1882200 [Baffinella frigidus]|nr:hypothetical protein T484DRAFT_1882200 [Cryptophyta sp. CCMP2293]
MRHRGFSQALLALLAANIAPAGVDGFALLPTPAWLPLAAGLPRCYREGSGSDGTLTGLRMANAGGRPGFWGKKQTIQWERALETASASKITSGEGLDMFVCRALPLLSATPQEAQTREA